MVNYLRFCALFNDSHYVHKISYYEQVVYNEAYFWQCGRIHKKRQYAD